MALRLKNSSGNFIALNAPSSIATDVTLTLPNTDGDADQVLSTDGSGALSFVNRMTAAGPAFSAYLDGTQTISLNTSTKVQFNAEEFDTASSYDSSTNYRFQPNIAGYYSCNFVTSFVSSSSAGRNITAFYKNGSIAPRMHDLQLSFGTTRIICNGTQLIYLNGSTDYLEVYFYTEGSGTITLGSANLYETCYFQAHLARPA